MLWSHQKKYPKLPHKISLYFWNICTFFLSFCLSSFLYLFIHLFIYLFIHLFIYLFVYLYWMYKYFDIFWYFAETCRKLFKLQTNHKWSLGFETGTKLFSMTPHMFHKFFWNYLYQHRHFFLHITLINVSAEALLCFSLTFFLTLAIFPLCQAM